jgi:hypothetical protein
MGIGKAAGITFGFLGALALGIAIGPAVREAIHTPDSAVNETAPLARDVAEQQKDRAASSPAQTRTRRAASPATTRAASPATAAVSVSEPKLHDRLKPVLNRGARMDLAADGFSSAEQFATVAHAARNTNVPFMVLKHRVLNEGRSLADAIREAKPAVDARAEVKRAREAAKADLAAVAG